MPTDERMEPLERLLNLVGLLLETRVPLTFEQIRDTLEPYAQDNNESAKRMFERDKDVIRGFGIPLELVDIDAWGTEQGYVIPKDRYYLPEMELSPDELGALLVAAQSGGEDPVAEGAVRKLVYGADGGVMAGLARGPLMTGSSVRGDLIQAVAAATDERRRLRFDYLTSKGELGTRSVDAFAMVYRGGHWYLVGHDVERHAIRAFRLSRMRSDPMDLGEGSEPPSGFSAADHVRARPWTGTSEDSAILGLSPDVAWWAADALVGAEATGTDDDGWTEVAVPIADDDALIAAVLELGDDAVVRAPERIRAEIVRRLEAARG
jgi:proteasome accessory factor B